MVTVEFFEWWNTLSGPSVSRSKSECRDMEGSRLTEDEVTGEIEDASRLGDRQSQVTTSP